MKKVNEKPKLVQGAESKMSNIEEFEDRNHHLLRRKWGVSADQERFQCRHFQAYVGRMGREGNIKRGGRLGRGNCLSLFNS